MTIANRLSSLMRWRGIRSQNQLARISGAAQSSISRIFTRRDHYAPTRETLVRLARALNTTPQWLSDGDYCSAPGCRHAQASGNSLTPASGSSEPAAQDGDMHELQSLMARLSTAERRVVLAMVRLAVRTPRPRPRGRERRIKAGCRRARACPDECPPSP